MSKKIIYKLFHYAFQNEACSFVLENSEDKIYINYLLANNEIKTLTLSKKLEKELLEGLYQILEIRDDEVVNRRYKKIKNKNYHLNFYITITDYKKSKKIIINSIHTPGKLLKLNSLGFQRKELQRLRDALKKKGLIIISSPYREGKSTTIQSLLQEINTEDKVIYFLDDQPEQLLDNINYLKRTPINWNKITKHDSDIIVCDDVNSPQDWKNIFYAANSGRLVIVGVKAKTSWEVLLNILRLALPLIFKLDSLKLILNQHLVPLKNPKTKRNDIAIAEILEINKEMQDYILKSKTRKKEKFWEQLGLLAIKNGFHSLGEDLKKKRRERIVKTK